MYAVVKIVCYKRHLRIGKVYCNATVMSTTENFDDAQENKQLLEAKDGHCYVVCKALP